MRPGEVSGAGLAVWVKIAKGRKWGKERLVTGSLRPLEATERFPLSETRVRRRLH